MDYNSTAQMIRQLASRFKAITEVADILDSIGSLEAAEASARAKLIATQSELAKTDTEVSLAQTSLEEVKDAAAKILADANTRADEVRSESEATSAKVLDAAERSARSTEQSAILRGQELIADATAQVEKIDAEAKVKAEAVADIDKMLASKSADLAEVTKAIEDHKAAMLAFANK